MTETFVCWVCKETFGKQVQRSHEEDALEPLEHIHVCNACFQDLLAEDPQLRKRYEKFLDGED